MQIYPSRDDKTNECHARALRGGTAAARQQFRPTRQAIEGLVGLLSRSGHGSMKPDSDIC